jgi:predicted O-linked N-acetylglucosamine transferase (SPINDLY family)
MDIALDPFPFNGGMTTLEALWMGVPVVTLEGNTVVSRQSYSALANIGLADELAFPDVDAYVTGAVALATDPVRLTALRAQIRPRMEASPLCQPERFTRDLEALYRRMWQAWCKGEHLAATV